MQGQRRNHSRIRFGNSRDKNIEDVLTVLLEDRVEVTFCTIMIVDKTLMEEELYARLQKRLQGLMKITRDDRSLRKWTVCGIKGHSKMGHIFEEGDR